ncbi:MAG: sialidase family protein [Planctomycetota bacterium]|nr:sialidase family protein [Planctomycetota bacterium]
MRYAAICLVLAVMLSFPAPTVAADTDQEQPSKLWMHREVPVDAPTLVDRLPRGRGQKLILAPLNNPYAPVQVNVDADGFNIPDDAANEPSIAVDPTAPNRMVIGWRQFDSTSSNFRQAGWAYSKDGGRTWTFPGVIEPGVFRSDPVLDVDSNGTFFYNSLTVVGSTYLCDVFKSIDGGETWDAGVSAYGGDKQWMAIDRTGGIGEGNIYASWTLWYSSCDGQFTRSYDGGYNFLDCIDVPGAPYWGTITVDPDGAVYVAGDGQVVAKSSTLQDEDLPPDFDFVRYPSLGGGAQGWAGPNPGGLLGQLWIASDHSDGPTRGNIYLLGSVDPQGTDPLDVMFCRSTDGGNTWSNPVRVNDDAQASNRWQWFATMSVAPNGRIDAVWNDNRNDPGGYDSQLFYSYSTDAGETWSADEPLTGAWDPYVGWPQQQKIGDYYDMVSDELGAHVAISTTLNGEQDVYYLRIGEYDCNGNGIADPDDIADGASYDCNDNGIPDECEIAADPELDADGSGVLDECEALGDLDGDGEVDTADLLTLLANWGDCPGGGEPCPGDLDGDGDVDTADLLALLGNWG